MINHESILYSMFYDMQSQGCDALITKDAAAVTSPGKPIWIKAREGLGQAEIRSFFYACVRKFKLPLTGIIAPEEVANTCAAMQGGGYAARQVTAYYLPEPPTGKFYISGRLRKAAASDVPLLEAWLTAFFAEAMEAEISSASDADTQMINENKLYLWQDQTPSAMGMLYSGSDSTARINLIYTPPGLRRSGYATAMVRALSEAAFQIKKMPVLYALTENAAANELYKSIGFKEAGRLTEIIFKK